MLLRHTKQVQVKILADLFAPEEKQAMYTKFNTRQ